MCFRQVVYIYVPLAAAKRRFSSAFPSYNTKQKTITNTTKYCTVKWLSVYWIVYVVSLSMFNGLCGLHVIPKNHTTHMTNYGNYFEWIHNSRRIYFGDVCIVNSMNLKAVPM